MRLSSKNWANTTLCMIVAFGMFAMWSFRTVSAQTAAPVTDNVQSDPVALQKEIEKLRNEKESEAKRVDEMRQEREQFIKDIRRVENLNQKYTKEIEDVRSQMEDQQKSFEDRLKKMEANLTEANNTKEKAVKSEIMPEAMLPPLEIEKQANAVLQKGGDVDPEDEKFKEELARAHYNMGNVYFERGEYQRAVVEYYQAVDLMPYDADAHFNLAFVSGEFLGDQETALKHYQWYLYLKPKAADRNLVEEKIVTAKLHARGKVNMKIDKPEQTGHLNIAR
ncbi:MAG: tetratricopeptide repeat protein [Candidatus Omnitrophica bacterium]|nr:tetratricopeptide repeat protein [Candidatus Omnitrophota bacterium]